MTDAQKHQEWLDSITSSWMLAGCHALCLVVTIALLVCSDRPVLMTDIEISLGVPSAAIFFHAVFMLVSLAYISNRKAHISNEKAKWSPDPFFLVWIPTIINEIVLISIAGSYVANTDSIAYHPGVIPSVVWNSPPGLTTSYFPTSTFTGMLEGAAVPAIQLPFAFLAAGRNKKRTLNDVRPASPIPLTPGTTSHCHSDDHPFETSDVVLQGRNEGLLRDGLVMAEDNSAASELDPEETLALHVQPRDLAGSSSTISDPSTNSTTSDLQTTTGSAQPASAQSIFTVTRSGEAASTLSPAPTLSTSWNRPEPWSGITVWSETLTAYSQVSEKGHKKKQWTSSVWTTFWSAAVTYDEPEYRAEVKLYEKQRASYAWTLVTFIAFEGVCILNDFAHLMGLCKCMPSKKQADKERAQPKGLVKFVSPKRRADKERIDHYRAHAVQ